MTATERDDLLRLLKLAAVAVTGLACVMAFMLRDVENSPLYIFVASTALCCGLFLAIVDIKLDEVKANWRIATIAVTFGVMFKWVFIATLCYLAMDDWRYIPLAMTTTAIDPISVNALTTSDRLSPRTKVILNLWASFDDPITALGSPMIVGLTLKAVHEGQATGASWTDILVDLAPFIVAMVVVLAIALLRRKFGEAMLAVFNHVDRNEPVKNGVAAGSVLLAAPVRVYIIPAIMALLVKPKVLQRWSPRLLKVILYGSTFMLGMVLEGDIDWHGGLLLGAATYFSQVPAAFLVVGIDWLVSRRDRVDSEENKKRPFSWDDLGVESAVGKQRPFTWRDMGHLALAQCNGLTAILVAVTLETMIAGTVAIVSAAIIVANVLHFAFNAAFDRIAGAQPQT